MSIKRNKTRINALKHGYRSGLEHSVLQSLTTRKCKVQYECLKVEWEDLAYRRYTPDFLLPNGIIVETKGRFTPADRMKHLCVKKQHPSLDIRFVFSNSNAKLRKGAKSTYADWCQKHGFLYADKDVPDDWLEEKKKKLAISDKAVIPVPFKKILR